MTPVILDAGLILRFVARRYDVSVELLRGRRRSRDLVAPRHAAIWLAKRLLPSRSLPQLANVFNRDHTTIMHAIRSIDDRRSWDDGLAAELLTMEAEIRAMAPIPSEDQEAALRLAGHISDHLTRMVNHFAARDPVGFLAAVGRVFEER